MSITKRGSTFHLRRRVPRRYREVEPRETVWISLHTDSETVAKSKAGRAWDQMIEAWEARLAGDTDDAEARYAAAHRRGEPLWKIRLVIVRNFERVGVEPPEDVFAFTTGGLLSDGNVRDWRSRLAA